MVCPVRLRVQEHGAYLCSIRKEKEVLESRLSWRMSSIGRPFKPSSRYDEALERPRRWGRVTWSIDQAKSTTVCGPNRDGAFIGLLVGAIDTWFLVKDLLPDWRCPKPALALDCFSSHLAGLVIVYLYKRFGGKTSKGWADLWCWARAWGRKSVLVALIMLTTWMSHLFGGSVDRKSVAVQIGATLSARHIQIPDASRIFLMTRDGSRFIAGLFPDATGSNLLRVLTIWGVAVDGSLSSSRASIVASFTSHALGLEKFAVPLKKQLSWT